MCYVFFFFFVFGFFFNDPATTEIYTLSLHDALPISMLYFADLGDADGATIRRAANEGEMLVAWDLPSGPGHSGASEPCDDCGRGVIGLGTFPADTRQDSPAVYTWSDGSDATTLTGPYRYGTEAFVHVTGFDCTYWVWSHLGADHLEYLLGQLRRVEGLPSS